jgi:heme-degrading monooxygenase HmoA
MYFHTENMPLFLALFESTKHEIRNFPGCLSLQLIQDIQKPQCIGTRSVWASEEDLEHYRNSELFQSTWAKTKVLFCAKPEATSYVLLDWIV